MHKHSPILLAGGVVAALLLGGCGKNDADSADTTTPAATPARPAKPGVPGVGATTPATGAGQAAAGKPAGGGADPFSPGAQNGGAPAQARPGSPAAPGKPGAAGMQTASVPRNSRDPFKIEWHKMPPPPYVFSDPNIQPLRVASADVEVPPVGDVTVREVADRRVSGIMSGDGVFAILESPGGDPEIVKPGSQTRDGYRVVSINADSLKLQRKDGNIVRTQVVPLTDQGVGGQQMTGGMFGSGGGGMRGGMPGSGGMPGAAGGMPGSGGGRPGRPGRPGAGGKFGGGGATGGD